MFVLLGVCVLGVAAMRWRGVGDGIQLPQRNYRELRNPLRDFCGREVSLLHIRDSLLESPT